MSIVRDQPSISVIIPAFNAAATIPAAIRSVLEQTRRPAEIVVVDDGSTDATAQVVSRLHPDVILHRQPNRGCAHARNAGAEIAAGDWLAFLDADDAWLPDKLAQQVALTGDPRVGVINCKKIAGGDGSPVSVISFDDLWRRNDVITSSTLVRRSAFVAQGGFWEDRRCESCEDYHLWLRMAAAGWTIANRAQDLVVYSPAPGSLSRQTAKFAAAEIVCVQDVAARVGVPGARLGDRIVAAYLKHARGAIHHRDLRLARRLAVRSLATRVSARQLGILALASAPAPMLDVLRTINRRRAEGRAGTRRLQG